MNDTELLNYFKDLSIKDILNLARKSMLLTTENSLLESKLEKIKETLDIYSDDDWKAIRVIEHILESEE